MRSSLGWLVTAVKPEVGEVSGSGPLLFVLVRSSVPLAARPENSEALKAFAVAVAGKLTVIVPPPGIAVTP
jgi:hypothetical protein